MLPEVFWSHATAVTDVMLSMFRCIFMPLSCVLKLHVNCKVSHLWLVDTADLTASVIVQNLLTLRWFAVVYEWHISEHDGLWLSKTECQVVMAVIVSMYVNVWEVDILLSSGYRLSLPKQFVFLFALLGNWQWIGLSVKPLFKGCNWCRPMSLSQNHSPFVVSN